MPACWRTRAGCFVRETAMSTTTRRGQNGVATADEPNLTAARFERAVRQEMSVERRGPGVYDVHHDGSTYAVDLESGHCGCEDCKFRGIGCKHSQRAALTAIFGEGVCTEFVARVARFAREQGCVHDVRGCSGPTAVGGRGYPCQQCIDAVRAPDVDEYTVWCVLNGRDC
jgi:hypothetical protein